MKVVNATQHIKQIDTETQGVQSKKKIERLYIHIGNNKTGSTTIQQSLFKARDNLIEQGIYYTRDINPNHLLTFTPMFVKNFRNLSYFILKRIYKENEFKALKNEFKKQFLFEFEQCRLNNCTSFIISAENLGYMVNNLDLVEMKGFLDNYFNEIKIVFYVREISEHVISSLQEGIKLGTILDKKCNINNYNYEKILKSYFDLFGEENVTIKVFNKNKYKNIKLTTEFLSIINPSLQINENNQICETVQNISYSNEVIFFLDKYNAKYNKIVDNKRNENRGLFYPRAKIYSGLGKDKFYCRYCYDSVELDILNSNIKFINKFLEEDEKFDLLTNEVSETTFFNITDLSEDFYIELIERYKYQSGYTVFKENKGSRLFNSQFEIYEKSKKENKIAELGLEFFIDFVNEIELEDAREKGFVIN